MIIIRPKDTLRERRFYDAISRTAVRKLNLIIRKDIDRHKFGVTSLLSWRSVWTLDSVINECEIVIDSRVC